MKNFEKYDFAVRDVSIASSMIEADDPKQLLRFCRNGRCKRCLFEPGNYRERFGSSQKGCYRNKMDFFFREAGE